MDKACAACGQAIRDEEEWFRVRQDYVHRFCSEKYLRLASARPKADAEAPPKVARDE